MAKLIVAVDAVQKMYNSNKEISSKFAKSFISLMADHTAPKAGATEEELDFHKMRVEKHLQKVKEQEEASFEEAMLPALEAFTGLKNFSFEIEGENFVIEVNDKLILAYIEESGNILNKVLPVLKAMMNLFNVASTSIKDLFEMTFEKK